jgi:hypothetical protein
MSGRVGRDGHFRFNCTVHFCQGTLALENVLHVLVGGASPVLELLIQLRDDGVAFRANLHVTSRNNGNDNEQSGTKIIKKA